VFISVGKGTSRSINEKDIDKYPSVLRKLQWWEERNEEELSKIKYAKTLAGNSVRAVLRFELSYLTVARYGL
jgi:hypothetical protein